MIETRHYDESDKSERDKGHDYLLRRLLLGERAAADPSRQQRRVCFHQVKRDRERRREIDRKESPGLPVIKASGRRKQQRRHDQEQNRQSAERFQTQRTHQAILARPTGRLPALSSLLLFP